VLSVNPFNYPNARSVKQGEDAIEEERRCLYVALTRAEDRLCLYRFSRSFRTQISDGGNKELSLYFLNNLPTELVNMVVNGQLRTDTHERVDQGQSEASFPEFDFE
jgi:DNA helicase II / ATP-dependent DNA helicase PcrA